MDASRLLIVEPDLDTRDLLENLLQEQGFRVVGAATLEEGIDAVEAQAFDLVLVSLSAEKSEQALASAAPLLAAAHPVPVGVTFTTECRAAELQAAGIRFGLRKPFDLEALLAGVADALDVALSREQQEQAELVRRYFELLTARDWDAFARLCTDDVVYDLPGQTAFSATVRGRPALRAFTEDTFARFEGARFSHVSVHALPRGLAARYEASWAGAGGATVRSSGAVVMQFRGRAIHHIGVRVNAERLERLVDRASAAHVS